MSKPDNRQNEPAVPPLYPMDPCGKMPYEPHPGYDFPHPIEYEPTPMPYEPKPYEPEPMPYEPTPCKPHPMPYEPAPCKPHPMYPEMPHMDCPMMNPRFMECMRVCMMMGCGKYQTYEDYSMTPEYPENTDYEKFQYIDLHKLSPYYNPETE